MQKPDSNGEPQIARRWCWPAISALENVGKGSTFTEVVREGFLEEAAFQ